VKRLIAMEVDDVIPRSSVERELASAAPIEVSTPEFAAAGSLPEFLESYLSRYFGEFGNVLPPPGLYERFLAEFEPPLLRATLAATNGNQLKAADLLGINRNTLRSKLRERNVRAVRGFGA
jgi:two-component system, NtrC family, nitrogen regulation response regulator GlnG